MFDSGFFRACEQRGFVQIEGEGLSWLEGCCLASETPTHCRIESAPLLMPVPGEGFADVRLDLELPRDFCMVVGRDGLAAGGEHGDKWKVVGETHRVASDLVAVVGPAVQSYQFVEFLWCGFRSGEVDGDVAGLVVAEATF